MKAKKVENYSFQPLNLSEDQFNKVAEMLYNMTGVHLPPIQKNYTMVSSRLNKVLRNHQIDNIETFLDYVQHPSNTSYRNDFISALTTHTTYFFREEKHFSILTDYLKKTYDHKSRFSNEIRIWCSASSTGQEAFSILMVLLEAKEQFQNQFPEVKFLATDIDIGALKQAAQAQYNQNEVKDVPKYFLQKYFDKKTLSYSHVYEFKKQYLDMIRFAKINLLDHAYPFQHSFDIIFCRNVLIYFKEEKARHVVHKLSQHLKTNGALFLGHSESNYGFNQPLLKAYDQAVYQKIKE